MQRPFEHGTKVGEPSVHGVEAAEKCPLLVVHRSLLPLSGLSVGLGSRTLTRPPQGYR
jgi:hypothetical protein